MSMFVELPYAGGQELETDEVRVTYVDLRSPDETPCELQIVNTPEGLVMDLFDSNTGKSLTTSSETAQEIADRLENPDRWNNDLIQFARLLSEMQSEGCFTPVVLAKLINATDMTHGNIATIMDRADAVFDKSKSEL